MVQVAAPRQAWRDSPDLTQEARVDLVDGAFEGDDQKAAVFGGRVATQPSTEGVDDGLAAVGSAESQLRGM